MVISPESTLVLIRGLPGDGKTSLAKRLFPDFEHYAADDFYDALGKFDPSLIGEAHGDCQRNCYAALKRGASVVVHNTFTEHWEMKPYLRMVDELMWNGLVLRVIHVDSGLTDEALASRNVHSVPIEVITRMRSHWQTYPGEETISGKESQD